jgi:hypothetical protein
MAILGRVIRTIKIRQDYRMYRMEMFRIPPPTPKTKEQNPVYPVDPV